MECATRTATFIIMMAWLVKETAILEVLSFTLSMTSNQIDPDGACNRATRALQGCLIEEGKRLAGVMHWQQALNTLFHAYALNPGATKVLNVIADIYDARNEPELAICCRRGVIPERVEQQIFNAPAIKKRIISARKASTCRHKKTHRPENVALDIPASNASPGLRPEFRAKTTESRGSFVSVLKDAGFWFDGFNTLVVDSQQKILREHIKGNAYVVADVARQRPEQTLEGIVCFLDSRSSSIYYHWMLDVLPKIALLQKAGIELESIDHFVVRSQSSFQQQTLRQLGIPLDRVVAPWTGGISRCQELIVPYLKHDRGDRFYNGLGLGMATWVPQWLKSKFLNGEDDPLQKSDTVKHSDVRDIETSTLSQRRSDKLYISRASRGTRTPVDEQRLTQELKKRGFNCVSLENLTIREQAFTMNAANMVVAPHGAGLTNIAFCKPGTTVIEVFGDYVVPCYWALSKLCKLDYHAYLASEANECSEEENEKEKPAKHKPLSLAQRRELGINVDIDKLLAYVDQVMSPEAMAS